MFKIQMSYKKLLINRTVFIQLLFLVTGEAHCINHNYIKAYINSQSELAVRFAQSLNTSLQLFKKRKQRNWCFAFGLVHGVISCH